MKPGLAWTRLNGGRDLLGVVQRWPKAKIRCARA
jgi:hypothetical protein